jgi:Ala-tRNA(Pro) deacylase
MQNSQKDIVCEYLRAHNIPFICHDHPAIFTVEEAIEKGVDLPGAGAKNLFLKDVSGTRFFLYALLNTTRADLKAFAKKVGVNKVTFATPEELLNFLGVTPGSVSLAGLLNDSQSVVEVYVDRALYDAPRMHLHPNVNTASLELTQSAFHAFLRSLPQTITIYDEGGVPSAS